MPATCPTCRRPLAEEIIITDAMLPQSLGLKRRPGGVAAIIYHTTGRGLAEVAAKAGLPGTVAYDEAALAWYRRSGHPYYAHVLVGPSGLAYRLADDGAWCQHAASLTEDQAAGRVEPPAWWRERWPGRRPPLVGRYINVRTVAVDALPQPDGTFSEAQLLACAQVGRQLAEAHSLTLERHHHLGHEDVDPWRRGITSSGVERPWDPGWDWHAFMARLMGAT